MNESTERYGGSDICDPDDDNDGVLDASDLCHFSVLPESVPTERLLPQQYAAFSRMTSHRGKPS